ncbi:hypothetical protein [Streptomyces tubercidicus]|uniref:hypothetical protein n=1 Tax=Streptomyces tubercidicus TaxID=47759 RepID=UPI00369C5973
MRSSDTARPTRGESRIAAFLPTALATAALTVAVLVCGGLVTSDGSGVRVEGPVATSERPGSANHGAHNSGRPAVRTPGRAVGPPVRPTNRPGKAIGR